MITIELQDAQGKKKFLIDVKQDTIAEASVIVYDGVSYAYAGMDGRFFSQVKFRECKPPVHIDKTEEY